MNIGVVGAGGVGGYIAAKLCALQEKTGNKKIDVTLIARGEHAKAIEQNGITIVEDDATWQAMPAHVSTAQEVTGSFDLLLLCVKSYDIDEAIASLAHAIRPDTVILPLANGVNHTEHIRTLIDAKVLYGAVYILAHIESPGVIRKKGDVFALVYGAEPQYIGEVLYLGYMFDDAGLRNKMPENIHEALWKKFLFISTFAALTTYFDMPIKPVMEAHPSLVASVLNEIAAVAHAKGIIIHDEIEKATNTALSLPDSATTSMHLDVQHHHRSEYETLVGYVVREGERLGVSTPSMTKIYNDLHERLSD